MWIYGKLVSFENGYEVLLSDNLIDEAGSVYLNLLEFINGFAFGFRFLLFCFVLFEASCCSSGVIDCVFCGIIF